ncbi:MAG: ubiquinol-cytochrome-c reductase complex assembly factor 3 [Clostridiales bacterium]|nr:ubiquinol-cytochrome-c reductase complex assembly factor 3 [Clostridiales bacterium]MCD7828130.1 ubiquinol-cytochrome-c reductase complex assembly factor 3 [Clostridiales bacterium]
MKKFLKVLAIVSAIAGVAAAVYIAVTKFMEKKQRIGNTEENYVSCSCCDDQFVSESVVA